MTAHLAHPNGYSFSPTTFGSKSIDVVDIAGGEVFRFRYDTKNRDIGTGFIDLGVLFDSVRRVHSLFGRVSWTNGLLFDAI